MKILATFFAVFLAMPASAGWRVRSTADRWGDPQPPYAMSEWVSPEESPGYLFEDVKAFLNVFECSASVIGFSEEALLPRQSDNIEVRIDGKRTEWRSSMFFDEFIVWEGEEFIKAWANAKTFEVLAPTYKHSVIFSFDMTGAKQAITKTCPDLSL